MLTAAPAAPATVVTVVGDRVNVKSGGGAVIVTATVAE
jgi:uncharacterized protein YodC (DUF2158 family)